MRTLIGTAFWRSSLPSHRLFLRKCRRFGFRRVTPRQMALPVLVVFYQGLLLEDAGNDGWQRFVARYCVQDLLSGDSVGSGPSTNIDGDSLNGLPSNTGLATAETYVCSLMISATGRAARPMDGHRSKIFS